MGNTGLDAAIGCVAEGTWGSFTAPTRWFLFNEESFALSVPRLESKGIGSGRRTKRSDQWALGRRTANGSVTFEVANKGFGLLFQHMLGTVATTTDGAGKKHTATSGTLFGKGLSWQVKRPSTDGTDNPFGYSGGKIAKWTFSQEGDGILELGLDFDFKDESYVSLTTPSPPAVFELFSWKSLAVTVAGSSFNATSIELNGETPLKTDRFYLAGSNLKAQQLENGLRNYSGTITGEFENMTQYNRFINADPGTPASMVSVVFTWTATSTYDTAKPFKLVVTMPAVRFDGATPTVGGPDLLSGEFPFTALDNTSVEPITIEYYTSDTTP